jgi:hypothetical protein
MSTADGVGNFRGIQTDHSHPNLRMPNAELGDQVVGAGVARC